VLLLGWAAGQVAVLHAEKAQQQIEVRNTVTASSTKDEQRFVHNTYVDSDHAVTSAFTHI
jgi:hypothetical protein